MTPNNHDVCYVLGTNSSNIKYFFLQSSLNIDSDLLFHHFVDLRKPSIGIEIALSSYYYSEFANFCIYLMIHITKDQEPLYQEVPLL